MAEIVVVFWRDIPAQVIARRGRRDQVRRVLSARFSDAIDRAAMRGKSRSDSEYLAGWRKSAGEACGEDLAGEAEKRLQALERDYDEARIARLVENGGTGADQETA